MPLDHLSHLREDSARFARVLADAPPTTVPTCPDWSTDDLLWHLAEVQWFWGTVVHDDVADPGTLQHPERPADREGLLTFFDRATALLQSSLRRTDPRERRWTWATHDQTAGFIRRRQAHEALIHRVDAELTAGVPRAPMDPALCADGVDEALRVMFGGAPDWATVDLDTAATLRLRATDAGQDWLVTLGTFSGTSPDSGTTYDASPLVEVSDPEGTGAAATVEGAAADLDCWLWGRPTTGAVRRSGDEDVHERFQQVVSEGID
jgi:uncharacterized protein (TIGR03083 family)